MRLIKFFWRSFSYLCSTSILFQSLLQGNLRDLSTFSSISKTVESASSRSVERSFDYQPFSLSLTGRAYLVLTFKAHRSLIPPSRPLPYRKQSFPSVQSRRTPSIEDQRTGNMPDAGKKRHIEERPAAGCKLYKVVWNPNVISCTEDGGASQYCP